MKKLALLLFALISFNIFSQYCGVASTNVAITPTTTAQLTASYNTGRRAFNFTATAGCTYQFETCGYSTADTYLRLYSTGTGGTLLASSDDACGLQSRIIWTCTTTGTYSILLTNFSCNALNVATRVRYIVNSCGATPYNPCSSITTIASCGTNVSTTMSGGGAGWSITNCGFSTPGQEKIFQFTPTQTGTYTLNVTSITGGYVDFFWKPASGGCGNTGWNCIDDISVTGSYNGVTPMTFTAGVTYYILLDPETSGSYNTTFNLGCPIVAPANDLICDATTITCGSLLAGTTIGSTLTGIGEGGSCGTTQTTGGVWYKVVGTGDVMTASLCATAWDSKMSVFQGTCSSPVCVGGIDDNGPSCAGTASSYSWISSPGVTYFILIHGYSTTSTFTLQFLCSPPPPPGPCLNTTAWAVENMPTNTTPFVTTLCSAGNGQFTDEYSQWNNGVAGETYSVESSIPTDWITVTVSTPNGTVVQYGTSPLLFTATANDVYYIHVNVNGYCGDDANCRDVTVSKSVALPIELMYFDGVNNGSNNLLYWATASEHNNDYFTLERSVDGTNWEEITKIVAVGQSTNEESYSYLDYSFNRGVVNYYRLSQTDFDGTREYFQIVSIHNTNTDKNIVKLINLSGQEIDEINATGVYIEVYDDGTMKKVVR